MPAIETNHLTKSYGKNRGIIDLNLTVRRGDFFGFIGPNGAGKSTTIRTLLGLIYAQSGSASVMGMDIRKQRAQILASVGYLPSEVALYHGMRVKDALVLAAGLHKKDCSRKANELCERLQLDPGKKIAELSFGNRKKVGIVCAMQHEPQLYIMDEPTSGLDPLMQREFFALLQEQNAAGATVFLSSHVLSEVQKYCRHAAVIREGKLLVTDSVENLGHTGAKRVTLRYKNFTDKQGVLTALQTLDGEATAVGNLQIREKQRASQISEGVSVRDLSVTEDGVCFLYSGDVTRLLHVLAQNPVADITITEPDLEEVFLHYYEKEVR